MSLFPECDNAFMANVRKWTIAALLVVLLVVCPPVLACTTFIVTKGASADGSVYVGHTNDGFGAGLVGDKVVAEMSQLVYVPPKDYPPGAVRAVRYDPNSGSDEPADAKESDSALVAYIPQVNHTYGYYTGAYGIMNEHQLMIGECTDYTKVKPAFDAKKRIFYSSELANIAGPARRSRLPIPTRRG
jgi:dipeptidase